MTPEHQFLQSTVTVEYAGRTVPIDCQFRLERYLEITTATVDGYYTARNSRPETVQKQVTYYRVAVLRVERECVDITDCVSDRIVELARQALQNCGSLLWDGDVRGLMAHRGVAGVRQWAGPRIGVVA